MKKPLPVLMLAIAGIILSFLSCHNQLIPHPTLGSTGTVVGGTNSSFGESSGWGAPDNLKATQGGYREITLSWDGVGGATRYYIYRAATQFESFVQVGETVGNETSYTMKVASGVDYYYRLTAVNQSGVQSPFSTIVRGTSLAVPLVSGIEGVEGKEDSDVTVYWYMGNVDAYQSQVRYNVICYDTKGQELARVPVDGSRSHKTEAIIPNLEPNTDYQYKVEAYLISAVEKVEAGDPMDAATARRLRPNAPEELSVQQGQSTTDIVLTFKLPAMVDVALPGGFYDQYPLYFKIYRREFVEGSTDTERGWELVKADFGKTALEPAENEMQKVNFGTEDMDYTPGTTVTYVDTNSLKRGVKYEYKVQSFAYYTEREITSQYSVSTRTGWLVAPASFSTGSYNTQPNGDKTANVSATLGFHFTWDTMGLDDEYHFILTETRYSLEKDEDDDISKEKESSFEKFTSLNDVNEYTRTFNGLDNKDVRGYYKYKLAIVSHSNTEILVLESLGRALVTDDVDLPVIKLFSATSGYNNKVELQWKHNPNYSYTVSYASNGGEAQTIDDTTLYTNQHREALQEDDIVTYVHDVAPGTKYEYKLTVTDNISVDSLPIVASTSKAPVPTIGIPSYDAITVSWEDVPAASMEVSARYNDSTIARANVIASQVVEGNNEESLSDVSRTVTFSQPSGYNNATISGKPLTVSVAAEIPVTRTVLSLLGDSGSSYETTVEDVESIKLTGTVGAATMGPALVNAATSIGTYSDKITLNWTKVEGATAYVILRNSLHISSESSGNNLRTEFENTDQFLITDVDGTPSITLNPAPTDIDFVKKYLTVEKTDTGFTLTDTLCQEESDDVTLGKWLRTQSQLSWGAPYEYIVLPLLSAQDAVEYDYETAPAVATVGPVTLASVQRPAGATKGYAWNIKATKGTYSENGENTGVKITWTRPWAKPTTAYSVYRAESIGASITWKRLDSPVDSNKYEYVDKTATPGIMYQYMIAPAVDVPTYYPYNNVAYKKYYDTVLDERYESERLANGFILPQIPFEVTRDKRNHNDSLGGQVRLTWNAPTTAQKTNYLFDGFLIEILNHNLSDEWQEMIKLTFNDNVQKMPVYGHNFDNSSGKLKVLRDYKLWFRIRTFTFDDAGEYVYSQSPSFEWNNAEGDANYDTTHIKWGARSLTPEEMLKAATLAMSVGLERAKSKRNGAGSNDQWSAAHGVGINSESLPGSGSSSLNSFNPSWGFGRGIYHQIKFNDYKPALLTKANRTVSFLTIKADTDESALYGETWSGTAIRAATEYHTRGAGNDTSRTPSHIKVIGPADVNGLYDATITFNYLNHEASPRNGDSSSNNQPKGIRLYTNGGTDFWTRGNITPLPFEGNNSRFLNDTEEWK